MTPRLVFILLFAIGLAMVLRGRGVRGRRGLSQGRTLDLDGRNLYSAKYGLAGRPDRVFDDGGMTIPEEWKSARRVHDSHRAQMVVYFILLEEETGVRPLYGVIVTGDGKRELVRNTDELRAWVLGIAEQIRAGRRQAVETIRVNQPAAKCRECGVWTSCVQARR
jgi:CRISPR/Cas system-associated exonuclease Cas4 (RecB family)